VAGGSSARSSLCGDPGERAGVACARGLPLPTSEPRRSAEGLRTREAGHERPHAQHRDGSPPRDKGDAERSSSVPYEPHSGHLASRDDRAKGTDLPRGGNPEPRWKVAHRSSGPFSKRRTSDRPRKDQARAGSAESLVFSAPRSAQAQGHSVRCLRRARGLRGPRLCQRERNHDAAARVCVAACPVNDPRRVDSCGSPRVRRGGPGAHVASPHGSCRRPPVATLTTGTHDRGDAQSAADTQQAGGLTHDTTIAARSAAAAAAAAGGRYSPATRPLRSGAPRERKLRVQTPTRISYVRPTRTSPRRDRARSADGYDNRADSHGKPVVRRGRKARGLGTSPRRLGRQLTSPYRFRLTGNTHKGVAGK